MCVFEEEVIGKLNKFFDTMTAPPPGAKKKCSLGPKSPSHYLPEESGIRRRDCTITGPGTTTQWKEGSFLKTPSLLRAEM